MNTITKRIRNFLLIILITVFFLPNNAMITSAATNKTVYEYSPMLEDRGNIYYIQRVEGEVYSYDIYQLEVATGNKTRLLTSKNDILGMMIHNDALYYTCYDGEKDTYQTSTVSIDTKEQKNICDGYFLYLDDCSIYYTVINGEESKLYKKNYESAEATLIFTGNENFNFVKAMDNTLYFSQFKEGSSKLTLYTLLPDQTKLSVLTTEKIASDETGIPKVSDVVKINGDIYYQYGTYQGSGNYWYGTLKKLDSNTNKKSVIVKQLYEDRIYYNEKGIFYNGTESSENRYLYNTMTGKNSSYNYKTTGTESFNILGDKTYCAKADGKESISISRFISGTNRKGLVKSFITISYKQNKKYDYYASVKKLGDYLLIPVTCMDYNDASYGWRGRCVGITWYVADSTGKILTQFK